MAWPPSLNSKWRTSEGTLWYVSEVIESGFPEAVLSYDPSEGRQASSITILKEEWDDWESRARQEGV